MSQMPGFATAITKGRKDVKTRWLPLHSCLGVQAAVDEGTL